MDRGTPGGEATVTGGGACECGTRAVWYDLETVTRGGKDEERQSRLLDIRVFFLFLIF